MSLPLSGFDFKFIDFKGLSGASDKWMSFEQTTVIVGRNNVGKSALIDALKFAVDPKQPFNPEWHRHGGNARYHLRQKLTERDLRSVFRENASGGAIGGNHWNYGKKHIGVEVSREFDVQRSPKWLAGPNFSDTAHEAQSYLSDLANNTLSPNARVFGIAAERNVVPEAQNVPAPVQANG